MSKPRISSTVYFICLFFAAGAINSPAQTLTNLISFNWNDGANPAYGSLMQASDGNIYGTTRAGGSLAGGDCGSGGCGTIFKITPDGTLTTFYIFCSLANCIDGAVPQAGLIQATDGSLYGTTYEGGADGYGTVFKITLAGTLTTLYNFSFCANECQDYPANPNSDLVQATNGNFYGTTVYGGGSNAGTVYEITPAGVLTALYSFCSLANCIDGANPVAGLIQTASGSLYGTTQYGGAGGSCVGSCGTVFEITPSGAFAVVHSFDSADGGNPLDGLLQASNGDLYGTTFGGGANSSGTVFVINPEGVLSTVYNFCAQTFCTDGASPYGGLIQGTDGDFYGTTYYGGDYGQGSVFRLTPGGAVTTLLSFDGTNGAYPYAGLLQARNGDLYGTAISGGADTYGTVFGLSAPPIVYACPGEQVCPPLPGISLPPSGVSPGLKVKPETIVKPKTIIRVDRQ